MTQLTLIFSAPAVACVKCTNATDCSYSLPNGGCVLVVAEKEHTIDEISVKLGIPRGTVNYVLQTAMKKLARRFRVAKIEPSMFVRAARRHALDAAQDYSVGGKK